MHKKNKELANIFERMADILEFLGDNPYRINTYRRVANVISEMGEDVEEAFYSGKLQKISGIGASSLLKIEEFLKTGKIKKFEDLRKKVPEDLLDLMEVPGIGPKTLRIAYDKLGVRSKEDFIKVLKDGRLARLKGFGEKKVKNILRGLEIWEKSKERIFIIEAYSIAEDIVEYMKNLDVIRDISIAGSLRRMKETIGDIDILVSAEKGNWYKIHDHFVKYPEVHDVLLKGETKSSIILNNGRQVDLRTVEPYQWGSALQYFTGSKEHNVHLRDIAKNMGYKISEYGIFKADTEERVGGATEDEIYSTLGMQTPPPEIREDWGEIELAMEHKIPELVSIEDIKGDFHMHTNWSDGLNTLEEMVEECVRLGYQYMVVGDHSQSSRVANGLDPKRYREQWKVIDKLRERYEKEGFYILKGCEVDILPDGSLDLPNDLLEEFDFVVASIHSRFSEDNTYRILKAMENPYVNLIGHPTGKAYGQREGYPLDMDRVIEMAKETGTALEINTFRADISPEYIRKCVENGVMMAVVTDAHAVTHLKYIKVGVGLARRGFAVPQYILNTYDIEGVRDFVKRKRYALK